MRKPQTLLWTGITATALLGVWIVPNIVRAQVAGAPAFEVAQAKVNNPVAMNDRFVYIVDGDRLLQLDGQMSLVNVARMEPERQGVAPVQSRQAGQGQTARDSASQSSGTRESQSQSQGGNAQSSSSASSRASGSASGQGGANIAGMMSGGNGNSMSQTFVAANNEVVVVTRGGKAFVFDANSLAGQNVVEIP